MLHHPLIEFSRSALEVITSNWKYEPLFRSVKTDLFFPLHAENSVWRERADRLENYCLAQGIYGERWFDEGRWFYKNIEGLNSILVCKQMKNVQCRQKSRLFAMKFAHH